MSNKKYYILYNPLANNGKGEEVAEFLPERLGETSVHTRNVIDYDSYWEIISELPEGANIILCGGDGTLNRFVNDTLGMNVSQNIYYYPTGTGNDFWNDVVPKDVSVRPYKINKYLGNLPSVTVRGRERRFINGIGYGIDGYACEEGDRQKAGTTKNINYTLIALKGIIHDYFPVNARVTVDGKVHSFSKVWMAPGMNGRYIGGGMMVTPMQNRLSEESTLTCMVLHDVGRPWILSKLPFVFSGRHTKYRDHIKFLRGHEITVEYDRPVALQIDGEVEKEVTEYTVRK